MMWVDYNIDSMGQQGEGFRVVGDWPGEVMGIGKDGSPKNSWLYKPGDVFVVDQNGWLRKSDHLSSLMMKYEESKIDKQSN